MNNTHVTDTGDTEPGGEMITVAQAHGQWLQGQRQAQGWSVPEMRRRLREAATTAGDKLPDNNSLSVMIHRWEDDRSGMSERYRLHYCRAFGIPIGSFGKPAVDSAPHANGSCPDDIARSGQAGPVLARLFGEPSAVFPVQIPPGSAELRTAVRHLSDPANHDELCFLLGYASAMMAATGRQAPIRTSGMNNVQASAIQQAETDAAKRRRPL